ncbi:MAG: YabP/YqfC family sporulation protein [Firmicutes bacterium]|nr:YabP/YqfC family sporulation protein [Bacillota bacterium]
MSFFNDTVLKLGLPHDNFVGGDKVSIFSGKGAFIEGHKGVFSVSEEEIVIKLKKEKVYISGNGLKITEINASEIYIIGKISGILRGQ